MNNAIFIDLFLIAAFFSFVGTSYYAVQKQKEPLLKLLSQGLVKDLFHSIRYLFLLMALLITAVIAVICWRIYHVLTLLDATGDSAIILMIVICTVTAYFLLYDFLGKLILIAARRLSL